MDNASQAKEELAGKIVIFKLHGGQNDGEEHRSDQPERNGNTPREMWRLSGGAAIGHTFGFGSERFGQIVREECGSQLHSAGIERAIEKHGLPPLQLYRIEKVSEHGNEIVVDCQYAGAREQGTPKV